MSYHQTTYRFRFEETGAIRRIYANFTDAFGDNREVEVNEELYQELVELNRSVRNIESASERHNEYRELSDQELAKRSGLVVPSAEEEALNQLLIEQVRLALLELPVIQSRRFIYAYVLGLTYAQIAREESCSESAVKQSLATAKSNILKFFGFKPARYPL